jgi:hypothetical protein
MQIVSTKTAVTMAVVAGSLLTNVLSSPRAAAQQATPAVANEHKLEDVGSWASGNITAYTLRDGAGRTFLITTAREGVAAVQKMPPR